VVKESVRNLIFDRFVDVIGKDDLFKGIFDDLASLVQQEKPSKTEIKNLLRRR
jgi:hypothetical protein